MVDDSYNASFFDDLEDKDFKIWKKINTAPIKKGMSDFRIIESILFKKSSKKTNFFKSRYYVLFEDRFGYFKVFKIITFIF